MAEEKTPTLADAEFEKDDQQPLRIEICENTRDAVIEVVRQVTKGSGTESKLAEVQGEQNLDALKARIEYAKHRNKLGTFIVIAALVIAVVAAGLLIRAGHQQLALLLWTHLLAVFAGSSTRGRAKLPSDSPPQAQ